MIYWYRCISVISSDKLFEKHDLRPILLTILPSQSNAVKLSFYSHLDFKVWTSINSCKWQTRCHGTWNNCSDIVAKNGVTLKLYFHQNDLRRRMCLWNGPSQSRIYLNKLALFSCIRTVKAKMHLWNHRLISNDNENESSFIAMNDINDITSDMKARLIDVK